MKEHKKWLCLSAVALAGALVAGCGQQGEPQVQAAPPIPVQVFHVSANPLALTSELPGRIEPVRVAEVRARVAGIVLSRHFEEGADVKAGQLLYRIDSAPFKATLARAQAEVARADAAFVEAQALVKRYAPLVELEAVSRQDFDAAQAALKSTQAARQAAQAEVQTAQLSLDYATVKAPISGRIGRSLVSEGALVGQNEATPLAMIQQIDTVYADFKQPVASLEKLRAAAANGRDVRLTMTLGTTGKPREGKLLFSDISVDRTTEQVSLRGQFSNQDGLLLPGMYVRVRTELGVDNEAILVPQRAVQRAPDGSANVLVVGAGDVVEARAVQTGAMHGSQWHVLSGLKPGERVVTDGAAAPGATVVVAGGAPASEPSGH